MNGFKIALLGDFHVRDRYSLDLAKRAIGAALDGAPDMVVIPGDFVGIWKPELVSKVGDMLEPLLIMGGNAVAVPGNHDYLGSDGSVLEEICDELNIKLLRNECWVHAGVNWVGVDSANAYRSDPITAMEAIDPSLPSIAIWHEPDMVEWLPEGCALMLAGHSHGGQFLTPWGQPFMVSKHGKKYRRGYYSQAPTPIYVTSGVGTTGPPSRLFCPPEVVFLELFAHGTD